MPDRVAERKQIIQKRQYIDRLIADGMRLNGVDIDMDDEKKFNFLFSTTSEDDEQDSPHRKSPTGEHVNVNDAFSTADKAFLTQGTDDDQDVKL